MNISAIPQFVLLWLIVNIGALLLLAVMSYFSSKWALDGLDAWERWLNRANVDEPKRDTVRQIQ